MILLKILHMMKWLKKVDAIDSDKQNPEENVEDVDKNIPVTIQVTLL